MKVLFVEDDVRVTNAARRFFRLQSGWELDIAQDGNEALRMFGEATYDAILIDWTLPAPGPDGLEVCRRIRRISGGVPLIFVTARGTTEEVVAALDAGADEFVTKPCDPRALLARVAALARRSSLPPARTQAVPANEQSGVTELELNHRQEQIVECLWRGLPNKEIATTLGCSVKNVEYHLGRMLRKTQSTSRVELMVRLRRRGLANS